jgi:plastocyanin
MSGSSTFTEAGTFAYYCVIHPSMTGTVTVTS